MTLVEFMSPLRAHPNGDKCLAALLFADLYEQRAKMSTEQIRKSLTLARVPHASTMNIADVMRKCGHYAHSVDTDKKPRLWKLTETGRDYVGSLLGLSGQQSEADHEGASLESLASGIDQQDVREYIEEAIKCLRAGALRAAVVFVWAGTIRTIQEKCLSNLSALNASLLRHDPKARNVSKVDDFQYFKDKNILLAAEDLAVIDKAERGTLGEALDLRNRCGHPNKYRPGIKKASSFIEDIAGIAFRN